MTVKPVHENYGPLAWHGRRPHYANTRLDDEKKQLASATHDAALYHSYDGFTAISNSLHFKISLGAIHFKISNNLDLKYDKAFGGLSPFDSKRTVRNVGC